MDFDLATLLSIVRTDEMRELKDCAICTILMMVTVVPFAAYLYKRLRHLGICFALVAAGFLYSMANKPPLQIAWDEYLKNDGSAWTTNSAGLTGVNFKWTKTNILLPNNEPLYISKCLTNDTEWVLLDTLTVGGSPRAETFADAGQYKFRVWHNWIPPSPVHTNGVWLGNVLEKTKDKSAIVIIKGKLIRDGKEIAPKKEE